MMRMTTLGFLAAFAATPAWSAGFVNGGFEAGDTTGWTTGGGYRGNVFNSALNPPDFLPGGSRYDASINHSAVVGPGIAPHTDGNLNQVYSGAYSFRAEDVFTGGYASAITQRVDNYTDANIFFAWAAVLQGAHGLNDAATFKLVLRDESLGADVIAREYNAATSGGGVDARFTLSSDGYYYTDWQIERLILDTSALGHDFSLTLLAADCEPTGHRGYVYLDGFGAVAPPVTLGEPSTLALLVLGMAGLAGARRRNRDQRPAH